MNQIRFTVLNSERWMVFIKSSQTRVKNLQQLKIKDKMFSRIFKHDIFEILDWNFIKLNNKRCNQWKWWPLLKIGGSLTYFFQYEIQENSSILYETMPILIGFRLMSCRLISERLIAALFPVSARSPVNIISGQKLKTIFKSTICLCKQFFN